LLAWNQVGGALSWKIDVLDAAKVVRITTAGTHESADIDRMTLEALEVAKKNGFDRYLVDDRAMVPKFRTLEIYNLPKRLLELGLTRDSRVAVVMAGDNPKREDFHFFQDRIVTFGGLDLRIFVDSEEIALAWLCGG
jgi:hypothetical protein